MEGFVFFILIIHFTVHTYFLYPGHPYNLAHLGKIVQEKKKKRLAYEHELFPFQS